MKRTIFKQKINTKGKLAQSIFHFSFFILLLIAVGCEGCGGVKPAITMNKSNSSPAKQDIEVNRHKPKDEHSHSENTDNQVAAPKLVPPSFSKPCLWKDAKLVAKIDDSTGKPYGDKRYRMYVLDNGFTKRESRIDFFDKNGNVAKSIDLRNADFAPAILQAKEVDDSTTMRMEDFSFVRSTLRKDQIIATLHPDYKNNENVIDGYTSSYVNYRSEEGPSKSIIVEYKIYIYINDQLHSQNNKIVILDSTGQTSHKLENIKYASNGPIVSDDLRYITFGVVDMVNTIDPETGGGPTGLMLYDFKEKKYLINKMFPSVENIDMYPNNPHKDGKYVEVSYRLDCNRYRSYNIDIKNEVIYEIGYFTCEENEITDWDWYNIAINNGTLNQCSNSKLKKLTYSQFNSLIFK
jgi:hypothetical protein